MSALLAFGSGAAYAGGLWALAAYVARRRALALGRLPFWMVMLSGLAALGVQAFVPAPMTIAAGTTLIGSFICALVDARTGLIFDALSLTMVTVAGACAAYDGRVTEGVVAVAVVGGLLAALYLLSGRRGIGLGDVKLGGAIAASYGVPSALIAIGSAFVLGAAYALVMIGLGRAKRSDAMRFGPFIAGGAGVGLVAAVVQPLW